jgi:mannose-6-phosphate isomerase-like protein (cupin superfamily)
MMLFSKEGCIEHYKLGIDCEGWVFVESHKLSVKQEKMPSGTSERLHYHQKSTQIFYILEGEATFKIEGNIFKIKSGEGVSIDAGKQHKINNEAEGVLEFILYSNPSTKGDRINIDEN